MTYVVVRPLGSGNFGEVFLEQDEGLGRYCAKKVIKLGVEPSVARIGEAALMVATKHANVARVYQADFENGFAFIRMEYLERGSVLDHYKGEPIDVATAIQLVGDACRGVQHLHIQGVVHRDLKPENFLLDVSGALKVSDFGLAARNDNRKHLTAIYQPHMSPEEAKSGIFLGSVAADVYALGVSAYRMFNGEDIFWATIRDVVDLRKTISRGAVPDRKRWLPHIHKALRRAVARSLTVDPTKRFQTAADFRHALEQSRPLVSWDCFQEPGRMHWVGLRQGEAAWNAELASRNGRVTFDARKRGPSGSYRRIASLGYSGSDLRTALESASTTLDQIATGAA